MERYSIRRFRFEDKPEWLRMRLALWPDHTPAEMEDETNQIIANADEQPVFVAAREANGLGGFLEGGLRKYGEGCETSPIGYIEGWYVDEDLRRMGVGGALVAAMEAWAREHGLVEIGSDTWLDNQTSIAAHEALGYSEAERLVHFAKKL